MTVTSRTRDVRNVDEYRTDDAIVHFIRYEAGAIKASIVENTLECVTS